MLINVHVLVFSLTTVTRTQGASNNNNKIVHKTHKIAILCPFLQNYF